MVKGELIKAFFTRLSNLANVLSEYSKTKNKKLFINNFLLEIIDIKGVDEELEKKLVESVINFIESFIVLFKTVKTCFQKQAD